MPDDAVFCTECGTKMEQPKQDSTEQPKAQPQTQNAQQNNQQYNQQYTGPQPNYYPQSPEDYAKKSVVSTGAFFGLNLLFSLPAIGWIICLVMAFAPQNQNIKNFARSKLIWIAIGIVVGIIAGVVFSAVFKELGADMDSYFSGYGYTM